MRVVVTPVETYGARAAEAEIVLDARGLVEFTQGTNVMGDVYVKTLKSCSGWRD